MAGLETVEPRRVKKGEPVVVGLAEDGTEGVVVHGEGFLGGSVSGNEFRFMATEVSRERPANYEELAQRVEEERTRGGYLVWVVGSALVHSRARADFEWFIANGYVNAVLVGNAVAVHDIEAAIYGTTLGMSNTGKAVMSGHGLHDAGHRPDPGGGLDRGGGLAGDRHQRDHARPRDPEGALCSGGFDPR
ncbi:MAG: hypothetical protein R2882_14365 [Gemmatimonadales bacterium]